MFNMMLPESLFYASNCSTKKTKKLNKNILKESFDQRRPCGTKAVDVYFENRKQKDNKHRKLSSPFTVTQPICYSNLFNLTLKKRQQKNFSNHSETD